jgi:hypothetical protein
MPTAEGVSPKVNVLISPHLRRQQWALLNQGMMLSSGAKSSPESATTEFEMREDGAEFNDVDDIAEDDNGSAIKILVSSQPSLRSKLSCLVMVTMLWLTVAGAIAGGGWLAIQLIINPGAVSWLSGIFPQWNDKPLTGQDTPQTLSEIQANAAERGLTLGEAIALTSGTQSASDDLLMPVLARSEQCGGIGATPAPVSLASSMGCERIVELRVYRHFGSQWLKPSFLLIDRLAVTGPAEFFVVAPLVLSPKDSQGSSQSLPFTQVSAIPGNPPADGGVWLQLSGEWQRGSVNVVYGQVVRYDLVRSRLDLLLPWTSPAEEVAQWQEVTGGNAAELVVNQTLGLEPGFQVYQVNRGSLEEISLAKPALDSRTYQQGIVLAQNGLWSPALRLLQRVKQRHQGKTPGWSASAQAQMDLVALHAQFTQAQAQQDWASPSQQITAKLVDGQWQEALRLLQVALQDGHDMTRLLQDGSGRLWKRVGIALQVNHNQPEVQAWGMLMLTAQRGRAAAIAWLQQQLQQIGAVPTSANALDSRIQDVLGLLNYVSTSPTNSHTSRFIGAVERISTVNPRDWLRPQSDALTLEEEQVWYRVQVSSFHDGQNWRRSPFRNLNLSPIDTAHQLWALLGLAHEPQIQIMAWTAAVQSQSIAATVRGVSFQNGTLQLLLAGDPLPDALSSRPLATTAATFHWLEPTRTLTLAELHQQQPTWTTVVLPVLWQELQQIEQLTRVAEVPPETMLQSIGSWSVQFMDVTGNNQPEGIMIVQPSSLSNSLTNAKESTVSLPANASSDTSSDASFNETDSADSRTMIFSDQGDLIYSDAHESERSLLGIAELADNRLPGLPVLIVRDSQSYRFRRWSSQHQRFE